MPSKKKKYNARFPPARIKKIMQMDEEVGKVAAAVPVIISRALELFLESFVRNSGAVTSSRNAKTLTPSHIKTSISTHPNFHFLHELISAIPDIQGEEEPSSASSNFEPQMPSLNSHHSCRVRRNKPKPANIGDPGPSHSTADESETWSGEDDSGSVESSSETMSDHCSSVSSSLAASSIPPPSFNPSLRTSHFTYSSLQSQNSTDNNIDEDYDL